MSRRGKVVRWQEEPATDLELEFLRLYAAGWSAQRIGERTRLTERQVRVIAGMVVWKFRAANMQQCVTLALMDGVITLNELLPLVVQAMGRADMAADEKEQL